MIDVHLKGAFYVSQPAYVAMRRPGYEADRQVLQLRDLAKLHEQHRQLVSRIGQLLQHTGIGGGAPMAHLVSTDKARLLAYGARVGLGEERLQYKPLKDPRTGVVREAWHWDLGGPFLPPRS